MQIFEAIEEIRVALENGVAQSANQFNEQHKNGSDYYFRNQRTGAKQLREMGRIKDAEAAEAQVENGLNSRETAYRRAIEEAKAEGPANWKKKYATRLDSDELERFAA